MARKDGIRHLPHPDADMNPFTKAPRGISTVQELREYAQRCLREQSEMKRKNGNVIMLAKLTLKLCDDLVRCCKDCDPEHVHEELNFIVHPKKPSDAR